MKKIFIAFTIVLIAALAFIIVRKTMARGGAFVVGAVAGSSIARRNNNNNKNYNQNQNNRYDQNDGDYRGYRN